jgi:hypothetical protein
MITSDFSSDDPNQTYFKLVILLMKSFSSWEWIEDRYPPAKVQSSLASLHVTFLCDIGSNGPQTPPSHQDNYPLVWFL